MSNGLNIETWPGVAEIEPTRRTEKLSGNTLLNTAKFKDEKREKITRHSCICTLDSLCRK